MAHLRDIPVTTASICVTFRDRYVPQSEPSVPHCGLQARHRASGGPLLHTGRAIPRLNACPCVFVRETTPGSAVFTLAPLHAHRSFTRNQLPHRARFATLFAVKLRATKVRRCKPAFTHNSPDCSVLKQPFQLLSSNIKSSEVTDNSEGT